MSHNIDPLKLQRLIDGELGRPEIRSILENAQDHPEHWREMAIAFVEDQMWQAEFRQTDVDDEGSGDTRLVRDNGESDYWSVPQWLTIAAGLLLALGAGYLAGDRGRTDDAMARVPGQSVSEQIAENVPTLSPDANNDTESFAPAMERTVAYKPNHYIRLQDQEGRDVMDSEIPMYDSQTARRAGLKFEAEPISEELRDYLLQRGYQSRQDVDYFSGRLDDGRRYMVPARTINFSQGQ